MRIHHENCDMGWDCNCDYLYKRDNQPIERARMQGLIPVVIHEAVFTEMGHPAPREFERTIFVLDDKDVLFHAADSELPDLFSKMAAFDDAAFIINDETFIKASWLSEQIPERKEVFEELRLKAVYRAKSSDQSTEEVHVAHKVQC